MKKFISITSFLFLMGALSHCGVANKESETFKTWLDKAQTHIATEVIATENKETLSELTVDQVKEKLSFVWSLEKVVEPTQEEKELKEEVFMAFNSEGFTKKLTREELKEDFDNSLETMTQGLSGESVDEDYFDKYEIEGLTLTFKLKENQKKIMKILSISEDTLVLAEMDGEIFTKTETWKKIEKEEEKKNEEK